MKVLDFCEFTQADAIPSRCVACFNELVGSRLSKVRPPSPGYTVQTWRSCARPRVEGLLALRNGQWEKEGCAMTVEGKVCFC